MLKGSAVSQPQDVIKAVRGPQVPAVLTGEGPGAIPPSYPQAASAHWQTFRPHSLLWTASGSEWS